MAKNTDEKLNIQEAITAFAKDDISKAGINLFTVLGYDTSLQASLDDKTYEEFKGNYMENSPNAERFSEEKAMTNEWKSIDILFQLTDDSFSGQLQLFDSKLDPLNPQSYLCFAIGLHGNEYTKSQIANITREVNKLFPIPIFIVFKYGEYLTLAIINRRVNKRDNNKDVLEKVTLIKDIIFAKPHRAHVEILYDMSLKQLETQIKFSVTNFDLLHKAWSEVLDTQTLNKRFYTELSNWYFWAIKTVVYPGSKMEADQNSLFMEDEKSREHNAKNLIRLLTRLLFVWFIKEKDLIPEELFDEQKIHNLITTFNPEYNTTEDKANPSASSCYYKAILQNLFFASLNAEQGKRAFRIDGQNQNATSLMRYKRYHKNPDDFIKLIESKVPFMNGGLFECLDQQDDERKGKKGGALVNYEDGFSDREDNKLFVPDFIFFGKNIKVDLSSEYDDKKKKDVTVNGIVNILQKYKFTIAENTPVEEDIALDPELLGRVFENLLASYNPETKTNARKQTGSFYTPRPIVEYMVDESLKAYLKTKIKDAALSKGSLEEITKSVEEIENNLDSKLDNLITYNEKEPEFTAEERFQILQYIDECKILDPACGSGAFPMGILQKMVYVIHKLDPQNDNWKQIQIQKISKDAKLTPKEKNELQKELLTVFDDNELDYARKLYLIENCIHGIDIQPIATQISRLRFFISLIVDQKVDDNKINFGIRTIPNLENRFVTANSLIGLNEETATLFDKDIEPLTERLQKVRHNLFNAKSPKYKFELRQEDKAIRTELEAALVKNGFGQKNAKLLSTWDPYDKNKTADFFDAEWMFGIKDGFDVVIGNPPYIFAREKISTKEKDYYSKNFEVAKYQLNTYILFMEQSIKLSTNSGLSTLIIPNSWLMTYYGTGIRKYLLKNTTVRQIVNLIGKTFETAGVETVILIVEKTQSNKDSEIAVLKSDDNLKICHFQNKLQISLDNGEDCEFTVFSDGESDSVIDAMIKKSEELDTVAQVKTGLKAYQKGKGIPKQTEDIVKKRPFDFYYKFDENTYKYLDGSNVLRYTHTWSEQWLQYGKHLAETRYLELFTCEKIIIREITGTYPKCINASYFNETFLFNCSNIAVIKREKQTYALKYILGILNSTAISYYFKKKTAKAERKLFPKIILKDLRKFPIPIATAEQQKPIIELVDKILAAKKADATSDTSELEHKIDVLVYELYGLTEDEIAIVEGK